MRISWESLISFEDMSVDAGLEAAGSFSWNDWLLSVNRINKKYKPLKTRILNVPQDRRKKEMKLEWTKGF